MTPAASGPFIRISCRLIARSLTGLRSRLRCRPGSQWAPDARRGAGSRLGCPMLPSPGLPVRCCRRSAIALASPWSRFSTTHGTLPFSLHTAAHLAQPGAAAAGDRVQLSADLHQPRDSEGNRQQGPQHQAHPQDGARVRDDADPLSDGPVVPAARPHHAQRRHQVLAQRVQRCHRRARAAPPATRALPAGPALSAAAVQDDVLRRDHPDDRRRDRSDRRLHRRIDQPPCVPGWPARHVYGLHFHAGLLAGSRGGRALSAAGLADPAPAEEDQPAVEGEGAAGARAVGPHRRNGRGRRRDPRQRHVPSRTRRHQRSPGQDLRDPLRRLQAQVLRQVPQQFPGPDHAVFLLLGRRLPRDQGQACRSARSSPCSPPTRTSSRRGRSS